MNSTEPLINCTDCGSDGFNIISGAFVICSSCNGTGMIVID